MKLQTREKCPVCYHTGQKEIYRKSYGSPELQGYLTAFYGIQGYPEPQQLGEEDFVLLECCDCGLVYQANVPDTQSLEELYTKWISYDKVQEVHLKNRNPGKQDGNYVMLRSIMAHLQKSNIRIFDFGFGYAELLKMAVLLNFEAFGSELNPQQVELARKWGIHVVDNNLEYQGEPMNVIFCEQTLEHVVEPRKVMEKLRRLSKRGTLLHVSVPNCGHVYEVIRDCDWTRMKEEKNSVNCFAPLEHINSFSHRQFVRLMQDFGFNPIHLKHQVKLKWIETDSKNQWKSFIRENINFLRSKIIKRRSSKSTSGFFIYEG